ncbi:MAG: DMT family transporter [Candidatus Rokubacteria bacterium]|nr:DMT family transporter [Candidatus Rokubacteria bacterium]MBI4594432.1 DMT family transporter [Candidatus Rokubacteria bacterium]
MSYVPIDLRGAALALLVSLFWGANPVAIKFGLEDSPPLRLAGYRFVVGIVVILGWAWRTGRLAGFRIRRDERRPLLVLGVLMTIQIASMNIATAMTSAAHVAIILNSYAVHIVLLAHFLIPGDRLIARRLVGVLAAYGGIVTLFVREAAPGAPTFAGDLVVFASALILAERTVYMAGAVQRIDPVKLLLSQAVIGIVSFWALSLVFEPEPTRWTLRLAGAVIFQGAVVSGFNFVVNLWLLKRHRPSTLSTFFLSQPIFGVLAAAVFTGDALTPDLLLASVAVAAGIGLTAR